MLIFQLNIFRTIYYNLKYLPLEVALKLPIYVYNRVLITGKGVFEVENTLRGSVKIGQHVSGIMSSKGEVTEIRNEGLITFRGRCQISYGSKVTCEKNARLQLGNNFVNTGVLKIACSDRITFGKNVTISWNVLVMDTDWHQIKDLQSDALSPKSQPIKIGNDNWIGFNTNILKGVETPCNTIVASNSLLNKSYLGHGSNILLGGIPVRLLRKDVIRVS